MRFESRHQHCIEQIGYLERLLKNKQPSTNDVMFLLSHTALQGLDAFEPVYNAAISTTKRRGTVRYIRSRKQEWLAIQQLKSFKRNFSNKELVRNLYSLDKPYFEKGRTNPKKLLILFTTMYNSFYVSNLAILSLIQEFGVSVLILKDSSIYNYLNGIPGYSENFTDAVQNINRFIENKGIEEVYISGFSSSGYASLLASCLLPCKKYLGFSIRSDLSADSPISPGKYFTEQAISGIAPQLLQNLAGRISANSATPYRLIYGSVSSNDAEHTNNLRDCENVDIEVVTGAGHVVISQLLIGGQLRKKFKEMFSVT